MPKYEIEFSMPDFQIVDFHLHFPIVQDDWMKSYRERYIEENGLERWGQLQILSGKEPSWLPNCNLIRWI